MKDIEKQVEKLESRITVLEKKQCNSDGLHSRLCDLEKKQCNIDGVQSRVDRLEVEFTKVKDKVDTLVKEFGTFTVNLTKDLTDYMDRNRNAQFNFIKWIVGSILVSLITGLCFQNSSFLKVHDRIHTLDKLIMEIKADSTQVRLPELPTKKVQ